MQLTDWSRSTLFKAEFTIEMENSYLVNQFLKVGSRFSLWRDEIDFTACQIEKVYNESGKIFPGETVVIEFSAINSQVTKTLTGGDLVFVGVPYTRIGAVKIVEILLADFKVKR